MQTLQSSPTVGTFGMHSIRSKGNRRTKLTLTEVAEVRKLATGGVSYSLIGARFGIGKSQVGRIVRFEQRTMTVRALLRLCS